MLAGLSAVLVLFVVLATVLLTGMHPPRRLRVAVRGRGRRAVLVRSPDDVPGFSSTQIALLAGAAMAMVGGAIYSCATP